MGDTWTDDDDEMLAAESNTLAGQMARLQVALRNVKYQILKAWRTGRQQYEDERRESER